MNKTEYGLASTLAWVYLIVILLALGVVLLLLRNKEPVKRVVTSNAKRTRKAK